MAFLTALLAGLLFGAGLLLSRMCDPQRVLAFLDVAGHWNPALAFTMGGAVLIAMPAFYFVRKRRADLLGDPTTLPNRFKITARLLGGSADLGVGWGLSGICPGPSLLLLTGTTVQSAVFFAGIVLGFFVSSRFDTAATRDSIESSHVM